MSRRRIASPEVAQAAKGLKKVAPGTLMSVLGDLHAALSAEEPLLSTPQLAALRQVIGYFKNGAERRIRAFERLRKELEQQRGVRDPASMVAVESMIEDLPFIADDRDRMRQEQAIIKELKEGGKQLRGSMEDGGSDQLIFPGDREPVKRGRWGDLAAKKAKLESDDGE